MAIDISPNMAYVTYTGGYVPKTDGTDFTVSVWVNTEGLDLTNNAFILQNITDAGGSNWILFILPDGHLRISRRFQFGGGFRATQVDNLVVPATGFHHLMVVEPNANNLYNEVYWDGVLQSNSTETAASSASPDFGSGEWYVGANKFTADLELDGQLAELGIWEGRLTSGEAASLAGTSGTPLRPNELVPASATLQFYAPFVNDADDDQGTASATLVGTPTFVAHPSGFSSTTLAAAVNIPTSVTGALTTSISLASLVEVLSAASGTLSGGAVPAATYKGNPPIAAMLKSTWI